ncbi:type 2 lanthipeptide synthetase LanM [Streptomyces sp. NPDC093591]|uniref:type 2 lanthipeptide synthetase LanM n=1 Tax=Streptomyces sp. NPDC093591 TaxID=3366044 RepID=UPI00380DD477
MTQPHVAIPAFLPFYRHLSPRRGVESALRDLIAPLTGPEHLDTVLDQVWEGLIGTVESQAFRALIGEFHAFREERGLPMSADSDEALGRFGRHLEDPAVCRRVLDTYPVLRERLDTMLANSLDAYEELFTAFGTDRAALTAAGLLPDPTAGPLPRLTGLFLTGSDLHNGNRQVVGVSLSDGTRLVYKPRALVADAFVRDLYAAAEPHLKHSLRDCLPTSVTVGSHGWQQFVRPEPMSGADQAARYFYRFGALCTIFGAIGASDLHDENLLACGEHPCVIDTETMVRPDAGVDNDSLPHVLLNQMKLSAASTMLVPMVNPTSPIDVLMAGVGIADEQPSSMTRSVIRDNGTDRISVGREPFTYRHGGNVPRIGDTALSATDHFPDILAGSTDALAFVRSDTISKVLDSYPDMPVRFLVRSTMVYGRFIDASTHPKYLGRPEDEERLFGLLGRFPDYLSTRGAAFVADEERASLRTGNVPYFISRGDSTELATLTARFPDVYRTSPLDNARRGVTLNARRSDAYHHFLLEECFAELHDEASPAGLSATGVFAPALRDAPGPGTWWRGIARGIADVGVSHDTPDGPELGWVCGIGPDRGTTTLTPGHYVSFHDSGGIVTFLRAAARLDDGLHEVARAADRGLSTLLAAYGEGLMQTPESVFTGASSLLLARSDRTDADWSAQTLDRIAERAAAGTLDTDLGNGPAGPLMVLLSRMERGELSADGDGDKYLTRLRDHTLDHLATPRTAAWYDVAHGELGLRWAASRIGRVLGDTRLAAQSAEWLTRRIGEAEQPTLPGWCKGAAGLLLSAAEILTTAGRADLLSGARLTALVDEATRLPEGRAVDLSVCHGSSGVVQSLIATARILDDPSLVDRARAYQERVLRHARRYGFCTGVAGRSSLLGYMLGWAGVGHTDLLLHHATTAGAGAGWGVPVAFTSDPRGKD